MNIGTMLISMGSMGGLGVLFSAGLAIANKKLHVKEDPRISEVNEWLPGANCGGCGYPGCQKFAEEVVLGNAEPAACTVASDDAIQEIAAILGVEVEAGERQIARVMCQGGIEETAIKAEYAGIESCLGANLTGGGEKLCSYGCIGFGDCVESCPFGAMYMNEDGLPVVIDELCTGCGNCVEACPRDVIELHPISHKLFVLCKNHDDPKTSRSLCTKACIGCRICVRAAEEDGMSMEDNLAVVNYENYGKTSELPTDKCPTNCLVILDSTDAEEAEEELEKEKAA